MSDEEIDAWENVFARWKAEHQLVFGMDGPQGKANSDKLFLRWEHWLYQIAPTEAELMGATEYLAGKLDTFDRHWESHYAMVREAILSKRQEMTKVAQNMKMRAEDEAWKLRHKESQDNRSLSAYLNGKVGAMNGIGNPKPEEAKP